MCLDELVATHAPRTGAPIQVADLNGDGLSDVIFVDDVQVWAALANGDRTFSAPKMVWPTLSTWVTAADADGDGTPDLVVTTDSAQVMAHGNGDGSFSAPQPFEEKSLLPLAAVNDAGPYYAVVTAAGPVSVQTDRLSFSSPAVTYFDVPLTFPLRRQGPLGILGIGADQSSVLKLLSDAAGPTIATFSKRPKAPTDYDEDGNTDLFVDGVLQVGQGDGTFTPKGASLKVDDATLFVAGDFDQDGHADLKLISSVSADASSIVSLQGAGNGQFAHSTPFYVRRNIKAPALPAHIDRSGSLDLIVEIYPTTGPREIRVLRGNCP